MTSRTSERGEPRSGEAPGSPPAGLAERLRRWLEIPIATSPQVAFDSETVLYISNDAGYPQAWSVLRNGREARRLLDSPERVGMLLPSPRAPEVVLAGDRGGNEHWQLELLALGERAARPQALTHDPDVIHQSAVWDAERGTVLFTSNARDRRFFDVYAFDPHRADPPRPLLQEDSWLAVLEAREGRVLVARHRTNLDTELLLSGGEDGWRSINPHEGEQIVFAAGLGRDAVYAAANPGREFAALVRLRPSAGGPEFLKEYPGDVENLRVAPDGESVLLTVNMGGVSETHLYAIPTGEDRPLRSGPHGVVGSMSFCPDGSGFVYELSHSDGQEIFYRSVETGKERRLTRSAAPLPASPVEPRRGAIRASDGLSVSYWEYVPRGREARGTILHVHGGPESQARPGFAPVIQFLVSEGWHVVAPNVRGSLGYGSRFLHLDDGVRRMDSVRDLKELAEALLREKKSRPGRIAVAGGSYGGFMVLASLVTYPELYAAGIDIVGISNFLTFLERTGPWRRRLREAEYGSLERDREFLKSISPLFQAERIRAPLLVVHGRNDPRVPFSEALQIVENLRARGRPVELLEYADEGHGLHRRTHQLETWTRAAEFLERHLAAAD